MPKVNILFLTSADRIGGAERVLLFILKKLNKDIFSATVVLPAEGLLSSELKKMGVEFIVLKWIKKLNLLRMSFTIGKIKCYNPLTMISNIAYISFYFFLSVVTLPSLFKNSKADIVHINSSDIAARAFLAGGLTGKPLILHAHDFLRPDIENRLLGKLVDRPFRIICVSNAVRRTFIRWSSRIHRIKTVYNGADLNIFDGVSDAAQAATLKGSLKLNTFVVGIVGRPDPIKGHETFLEAASKVIGTIKEISFLVVGSWVLDFEKPRVEFLKEYSKKLGLEDKVVFTGFISDMKEYYNLMDIVVLLSWNEPFALVPLEAMACRKPVIGTNVGGTPELIKDRVNGILIPPKDPDALAEAIIMLLRDERLRMDLASEGRKEVEKHFNGDRFIEEMECIYKEAVSVI